MKVTVNEQGQLVIDVHTLVESMNDESRKQFYQHLAFQDTLMVAVVDTIANGVCFEGDWWSTGIENKMREKLLPLAGSNAVELFRKQLEKISSLEGKLSGMREKFTKLVAHWPSEVSKPNECLADYNPSYGCSCAWKRDEVIDFLKDHKIEINSLEPVEST